MYIISILRNGPKKPSNVHTKVSLKQMFRRQHFYFPWQDNYGS